MNLNADTIKEWEDAIVAYNTGMKEATPLETWFEVCHPTMNKAWFVVVQLPQEIPMPEFTQNELLTVEIPLTISDYKGMSTKVEPTAA